MKFYVNMTSVCGPGYEFQSVVRGLHIYKEIWTTVINGKLFVKKEDYNEPDRYALSVVRHNFSDETKDETVVLHSSGRISFLYNNRKKEKIEVLHTYHCTETNKLIRQLKKKL